MALAPRTETLESKAKSPLRFEAEEPEKAPDFAREIRPILSDNCFVCHGPDEDVREADVRIDQLEGVFSDRGGYSLVVPGKPEESELYLRITDRNDPMPPPESDKSLGEAEIEAIRSWIEAGASWDEHWAYRTPARPPVPQAAGSTWPENDLDRFVLDRLTREELAPEPEASRETLLRRLTLDLTGLPPTVDELDAYLADGEPSAYERQVDRLLASPRFGEHMARAWLDAARYGDTHGFHLDNERLIWPYRDWVIQALNDNISFDRFTIEQLAGDLLPDPTLDQIVATGFQRLNPTTAEGGFIAEEYLVKYAVDRVETMGTVWMGTTMACAQCHDHKYDPISQKEFYELFAFFNNTAEAASDGNQPSPSPTVKVPSPAQATRRSAYREAIATAEERLDQPMPEVDARQAVWEEQWRNRLEKRWTPLEIRAFATRDGSTLEYREDGSIAASGTNPTREMYEVLAGSALERITAVRLEILPDENAPLGGSVGRGVNGNFVLGEIELQAASAGRPSAFGDVRLTAASADHSQENWPITAAIDGDATTGWAILPARASEHSAIFLPQEPIAHASGSLLRLRLGFDSAHAGHSLSRFRLHVSDDEELAPARFGPWFLLGPFTEEESGDAAFDRDYGVEAGSIDLTETVAELSWVEHPEWEDGVIHSLEGASRAAYLLREIQVPGEREVTIALGSDDAIKVWCNGELVLSERVARPAARAQNRVVLPLRKGRNQLLMKVVNYGGEYAFVTETVDDPYGGVPESIASKLRDGHADEADESELRRYYRKHNSREYAELLDELAQAEADAAALESEIPSTLIAEERVETRAAHVLVRGSYAAKAEEVQPATPAFLPPLTVPGGARSSRLDLARWLVDGNHPLTSRVTANRLWQELFGVGLVKTAEDFGSQGEFPSHPELLDHLALELSENGWDVKAFLKGILMSSTYRQRSSTSAEKRARDPDNRLFSRGPRFRLEAERIRDSVLAISGLLVERIGGPSVRPYQPDGIWEAVGYTSSNTARYMRDAGDALYRRSLYTFWKRTAPPAAMQIFDAPTRESCIVARARTNTPLQALALMNDTQYVEAARAFAERLLAEGDAADEARLTRAFRSVVSRHPDASELEVLGTLLSQGRKQYRSDAENATSLIHVGESTPGDTVNEAELAAWTVVCNLLFNLDEFVTKE